MEGQRKLKAAKVLCIGAGGLGSPVALYLAAAGVGTHRHRRLRRRRLQQPAAADPARHDRRRPIEAGVGDATSSLALNPERAASRLYETALSSANALDLFRPYDVIVDGTDNFPTRYLVNDACVLLGKPNAYGSIFRFEGPGVGVRRRGRPVLPLPLPGAAAARPRPELRRRRRARRAARASSAPSRPPRRSS